MYIAQFAKSCKDKGLECGLIAKKAKLCVEVSRLLVSRPLGLIVGRHETETDIYCTNSALALNTDKLLITGVV